MPELPEVETVRRALSPLMIGMTITRVRIIDERLCRPESPRSVAAHMRGRQVRDISRRGKYLLLELDNDIIAEHHLRMTGTFLVRALDDAAPPHARMAYSLGETVIWYCDVRRFGTLHVASARSIRQRLDERLGVEPFNGGEVSRALARACARRHGAIKAVLLDQRVIAGLGNIYVDEALHAAGIDPRRSANRIAAARLERLAVAIVDVIAIAIAAQGSTVSDFRSVDGSYGSMQEQLLVYGRAGAPCASCGTLLRHGKIAGRTSVWCGVCQR